MKIARQPLETKQRLLHSACFVFAEKGFHHASVAEICRHAEANIAAVNYHFQSKENLYREVLAFACAVAQKEYPFDDGVCPDDPPTCRLKVFITSHLRRTFDDGIPGCFHRMLAQEFSNPDVGADILGKSVLRPQADYLLDVVRDLLSGDVSEHRLRFCCFSVISLCAFFNFNRVVRGRFLNDEDLASDRTEWLAEHLTQFALQGLSYVADGDGESGT